MFQFIILTSCYVCFRLAFTRLDTDGFTVRCDSVHTGVFPDTVSDGLPSGQVERGFAVSLLLFNCKCMTILLQKQYFRPSNVDISLIMTVQIINKSKHPLPAYATELSAGMDLRANLDQPITLAPLQRCLVPTGLYIALPAGFEGQVRPRSGLALKHGVTVLNAPGTVDADYRGELRVILVNLSDKPFVIEDGERIAQLVVARHEHARWEETDRLEQTVRGEGGFGHTGVK